MIFADVRGKGLANLGICGNEFKKLRTLFMDGLLSKGAEKWVRFWYLPPGPLMEAYILMTINWTTD